MGVEWHRGGLSSVGGGIVIVVRERPAPEPPAVEVESDDDLYLALHGARERLCVAQMTAPPGEKRRIGAAIARIDAIGSTLPAWSKYNRSHEQDPEPPAVEVGQRCEHTLAHRYGSNVWCPWCVRFIAVQIKASDLKAGMVEHGTGRMVASHQHFAPIMVDGKAVAVRPLWKGTWKGGNIDPWVAPDALYSITVESLPDGWQPSEHSEPPSAPPKRRMRAPKCSGTHTEDDYCATVGCTPVEPSGEGES